MTIFRLCRPNHEVISLFAGWAVAIYKMPPKTNKQKMIERQNRYKDNPILREEYLQKDRERKRKARLEERKKMSPIQLKRLKIQESERVKKYYKEKRKTRMAYEQPAAQLQGQEDNLNLTPKTPYKSRQAFGKAVKRAVDTLPNSPNKRKAVVVSLAEQCGLNVRHLSTQKVRSDFEDRKEMETAVLNFYQSDDVSWQAPGRKDKVVCYETDNITGERKKVEMQTRYLLMSVQEAHKLFLETNPIHTLGKSKFASMRPKHCKLFDKIPHNVCVCTYHENVRLLLEGLKDHAYLSTVFETFIGKVVCDSSSKACMTSHCNLCQGKIRTFTPSPESLVQPLKYWQWQKAEKKAEKVEILCTVQEAFNELVVQLQPFLLHTYVKRKQAATFKELQGIVNGEEILLQVDFSENASLLNQNEIQSAHWSHGQATVFTAYAWISDGINKSIVLVSDNLDHTKVSVFKYMDTILTLLKHEHKNIKIVNVFSDGAASQFKQRYLFANLQVFEEDHDIKIKWHFFATSHGKGVVDGIGGTVKRSVWRYVKTGAVNVNTPEMFAKVAAERNPNVHIEFVSNENIEKNRTTLEEYWADTLPIPNCLSLHCVYPQGKGHLFISDVSSSRNFTKVRVKDIEAESNTNDDNDDIDDINVNDWVVVTYDNMKFPGIVTQLGSQNDIEVKAMHKAGSYYKWPERDDIVFYLRQDILMKVEPPSVKGSRGQYAFSETF